MQRGQTGCRCRSRRRQRCSADSVAPRHPNQNATATDRPLRTPHVRKARHRAAPESRPDRLPGSQTSRPEIQAQDCRGLPGSRSAYLSPTWRNSAVGTRTNKHAAAGVTVASGFQPGVVRMAVDLFFERIQNAHPRIRSKRRSWNGHSINFRGLTPVVSALSISIQNCRIENSVIPAERHPSG